MARKGKSGLPPEYKEALLALAVVFLVALFLSHKLSAAIAAGLGGAFLVSPLYVVLRFQVVRKPSWRLLALVAGFAVVWWYSEKYHDAREHVVAYRTGSVGQDGRVSDATGSGAQSHHGGVDYWLTERALVKRTDAQRRIEAFGRMPLGPSIGAVLLLAGVLPNVFSLKSD